MKQMKKNIFLLPMALLGLLTCVFTGCESDDDKKAEVCEEYSQKLCTAPEQATSCCDSDGNCHYVYQKKRYEDTPEGLEQLSIAMCGPLESAAQQTVIGKLKAHTMKMLNEAKVCSLCE
ncbi:hypothetical protein DMA11_04255 [Marinilabiliaceae bacterium JC017]|nr:hypothetical protein DMA11_04255 [Marinilabiliaceae bacterium JC017]